MNPPNPHVDVRPLILLLIVVVLIAGIAWTAQQPVEAATSQTQIAPTQPALTAPQITATPSRFPEYLTDQNQTNGIILGSTILVLIVVIGTLTIIRHGNRHTQ